MYGILLIFSQHLQKENKPKSKEQIQQKIRIIWSGSRRTVLGVPVA